MTLGYLPYYMQGMDMGVLKNEVSDAAAQMGFRCEKRTEAALLRLAGYRHFEKNREIRAEKANRKRGQDAAITISG